jgi:hypothetical protein
VIVSLRQILVLGSTSQPDPDLFATAYSNSPVRSASHRRGFQRLSCSLRFVLQLALLLAYKLVHNIIISAKEVVEDKVQVETINFVL